MESIHNESKTPTRIGDRSTSDVVVRVRTQEGRDEWIYCHSQVLMDRSKYFADRLSDNWPTCQILDSRNCVEVYCEEGDFDYHVTVLRLFYAITDSGVPDMSHGVKNALGMLRVAINLGCPQLISACVDYLEAVPWEEAEEEEILKTIPGLGSQVERILARLQPVNPTAIIKIFLSALRFATSSPPSSMRDLKTSAQEQLDYMLTEDDDAPLLTADMEIKLVAVQCVKRLFERFNKLVDSSLCDLEESIFDAAKMQLILSYLEDISWACQILVKLESMRDFVCSWVEASSSIIRVVQEADPDTVTIETKLKVVEVTSKVLEAIGYGTVILPTAKRLQVVNTWLPFARVVKPLIDSTADDGNDLMLKADGEFWHSLEAALVSIILSLPSDDQAEILTKWLEDEGIRYPDLTEAFEVWCYRSKVAKRRLAVLGDTNGTTKKV